LGAGVEDAFEDDACSICLDPFTPQDPATVYHSITLCLFIFFSFLGNKKEVYVSVGIKFRK
jgi:hypothetical protein